MALEVTTEMRSTLYICVLAVMLICLSALVYKSSYNSNQGEGNDCQDNGDGFTVYDIKCSQDPDDYSYTFQIKSIYDTFGRVEKPEPVPTGDVMIELSISPDRLRTSTDEQRDRGIPLTVTSNEYSLPDYQSTHSYVFQYFTERNDSKSFLDRDYVNLSMNVSFVDSDSDGLLTVGDIIEISTTLTDTGSMYDLSHFVLKLFTIEGYRGAISIEYEPDVVDGGKVADEGEIGMGTSEEHSKP